MKGHIGGDGLYWVGLTRRELYLLGLCLSESDLGALTDRTIRQINKIRDELLKLERESRVDGS